MMAPLNTEVIESGLASPNAYKSGGLQAAADIFVCSC